MAQAFVNAAPRANGVGQRLAASLARPRDKPDERVLFDLLAEWAPAEATRQRILVENPETLYGFARSG